MIEVDFRESFDDEVNGVLFGETSEAQAVGASIVSGALLLWVLTVKGSSYRVAGDSSISLLADSIETPPSLRLGLTEDSGVCCILLIPIIDNLVFLLFNNLTKLFSLKTTQLDRFNSKLRIIFYS